MSNAQFKLMCTVFARRLASGETFEEIAESYPKLTAEDLERIREALT